MRRNDVVYKQENTYYSSYGRIVRIIGYKALWIDCDGVIKINAIVDLETVKYTGRLEWTPFSDENGNPVMYNFHKNVDVKWDDIGRPTNPKFCRRLRFIRMPTLRKLKQISSRRNGKNAWRTSLDYEYIQS